MATYTSHPIEVGDIISNRLITGEVLAVGEVTFGRLTIPGFRVRVLGGREAGRESFIPSSDNPTRWLNGKEGR